MTGVAVVIPCFNRGRTLRATLESVLAQTRPAAEIVIVDDGSDDLFTRQALSQIQSEGIWVVRTPKRGVASARNVGVSLTSAPYVAVLDADDCLDPTCVARLAAVLDERQDLDFITCERQLFENDDSTGATPHWDWVQTLSRDGSHTSTMFRRIVWDAVQGFDPALDGCEDMDFRLTALERNCRGDVLPEPLVRSRVQKGSRSPQAIESRRYVETMDRIHHKHPPPTHEAAVGLLVAKDRFLAEQRSHQQHLEGRKAVLEQTIRVLRDHVAVATTELAAAGKDAIDWGDLRQTAPISPVWGLDRGKPVDRYYIEGFLESHRRAIRGSVLEVKDSFYTRHFGGDRVSRSDVVDIDDTNPQATIVADLARIDGLPEETYDCFILTQTLHIIYDIKAVVAAAYRTLKPGGVLLCTVPCASRINFEDGGLEDGDFWRFTEASARALFSEAFPLECLEITSFGNLRVCAAFLHGLAVHEVACDVLDHLDPWFPLMCGIRATKPAPSVPADVGTPGRADPARQRAAILLYHRVGSRVPDTHGLCVDVSDFRDHMRHLRERYVPMALDDLVTALRRESAPPNAVAVTLDDGYLEHLTVVSPILLESGIPATFFVNTERLDQPHENSWDVLERILMSDGPLPDELDLYMDGRWVRPTRTAADRARVQTDLIEMAYPLAASERDNLVRRVSDWSGLALEPRETHRPMTSGEIRRLASRTGHSIGAHSVHHLSLPNHGIAVQIEQAVACKRELEDVLGRAVESFSYPYGVWRGETVLAVRAAGFSLATTVEGRVARPGCERLLLPRIEIKRCGLSDFAERMERLFR